MLTSFALILLFGFIFGYIFQKFKIPGLVGMILVGILLGTSVFNVLDPQIYKMSADLRSIALIVILTRAGLSLDIQELKKVGRPALLMCFVPATFEIVGMIIIGPILFGISVLDAAILGSVLAAVSPAVIVPRMIHYLHEGYGVKKGIPQLIMAGASVDDVFVIVLFTSLLSLAKSGSFAVMNILEIPISIATAVVFGSFFGYILTFIFKRIHIRDTIKVILILSFSFLLIELEKHIPIPFSALLAIMVTGISIRQFYPVLAKRLEAKYNRIWVGAEIILFVLVGTLIDIGYVEKIGLFAILALLFALSVRMLGVYTSLIKTNLTNREKLFCMVAYTPKATVQAAIGSIALAMGLPVGELVLAVSILSIIVTAPLGALAMDQSHKHLLERNVAQKL